MELTVVLLYVFYYIIFSTHTAKKQFRKFEPNIPRKGFVRPESQFPHSCVCELFKYSHVRSAFSDEGNMWTDPGNINRSQTHECRNWVWGHAILRIGINKWVFRCSTVETDNVFTGGTWDVPLLHRQGLFPTMEKEKNMSFIRMYYMYTICIFLRCFLPLPSPTLLHTSIPQMNYYLS